MYFGEDSSNSRIEKHLSLSEAMVIAQMTWAKLS
jgi:hypothetical protein